MTPNFQRLADESVAFMNAYLPSSACAPSRAGLMIGIRAHVSGAVSNEAGLWFCGIPALAEATTLAELLKGNGWYTAETGKIFHGTRDFDMADRNRSWTDCTYITENAGQSTESPRAGGALGWSTEGGTTADVTMHNDYCAADFIARVLENGTATNDSSTFTLPENSPFFLACGIYKPHLPFYTTQRMIDLFPVEEMNVTRELLQYFIDDASDLPPVRLSWSGTEINDSVDVVLNKDRFIEILKYGLTIEPVDGDLLGWKDMLKHYFACVATADRALGRLLNALENSSYADNTMVILWRDHGYHLGEKTHVTKFTLWDDASRVYFMIKDPRNPQSAGQRCYQPVSLIDIYPTVAGMANLELPDVRITGRDLFPLLKDSSHNWAPPALTTFRTTTSNMIRDHRYKLIRYEGNNKQLELYDMDNDNEEYFNLAKNPEYESVLTQMINLMDNAIEEGKTR